MWIAERDESFLLIIGAFSFVKYRGHVVALVDGWPSPALKWRCRRPGG
jgi:hypothetical protein